MSKWCAGKTKIREYRRMSEQLGLLESRIRYENIKEKKENSWRWENNWGSRLNQLHTRCKKKEKKKKQGHTRECMSNELLSNFILDMRERARKKKQATTTKRIS